MEYQTSSTSVTLSQTSTGHSIYDGVFASAAPSNFTISSSFDDYREIFGTATSSSIPVLQVPELNERKASVDVRSSKLDYSNVFVGGGGFGDGGSNFALTYEELFAEPKKRTKLMHKETRIQIERVSPTKKKAKSKSSCSVESVDLPNESAFESYDGVKKFKMSYNRSNHRSKSFAGVHTVPAYTCSMDETSPLCSTDGDIKKPVTVLPVANERAVEGGNSPAKAVTRDLGDGDVKVEDKSNWKSSVEELFNSNKPAPAFSSQVLFDGDKPVSLVINDASHVNGFERHNGASHHRQASRDQQAADASKQTFGGVPKAQNSSKWRSSGSIDKKNYSGEIAQESRPSNMPPFSLMPSEGKSEVEKSVVSMFGVSNADIFRGGDSVASPPYYDEEVDSNSVAAASVAALTKAIEEAQASIRMAKELMDRKKVGVQSRVKLSFDDSTKPELSKRNKLAERASMSTKTKSRELYDKADVPANVFVQPEQVTPVLENVIISSDVMVPKEEMHSEKIADNGRIFKEVETRELHEEVDVALDVSAGPEQVSVAIEEADLKETRGKVHDEEFRPTPTDHRLEEVDDSEASEQFYEFADTGKEVISEAVEQFFEFADSSEPDVSEAADEFYEFSDSSEHRELKLENEEVNSTGQTFPLVDDDDDEQHKKTDMEDLDKPEQDSKSLEASTEEHREVESIFNVVRGISDFREHANELASSKEDSGQDDDDEKRQEALRELEESGKLEATHVNETSEEKQNGDDEKFESQELYETEHVKINLVTQEQVENEKTGVDACMQKDDERGQTDAPSEEDTERSLNKDSDEVTIETANDFYDKEDSDKRLEDDSESDGHDKLQDIKLNEMIHEEATYQKKECENSQEESFEVVDDGREHTDAHRVEDTERSLNKGSDEVIIETVNDFYNKEDIDKRLEDGSKSDGHDKLQDIKLNEMILEEATYQKKESENSQEENFEVVYDGRGQTDAHKVEDTERSLNKDSDEVTIETVNDFYDKEDSDKRLEDDSKSDGHDKLQDIKLNEMIHEEATYQKKECENSQEESFEVVDDGRGQTDAHRVEDTERSLNKGSDEVIIETVNDFYDKEDIDKRLEDGSKSDGHDNLQDIKLDEMILEEASYQKKECENSQEESFEVVDVGRMQILTDESTKDEKVKATQEDQKNLACEVETGDNLYEQGAKEDLYNEQGSARHVDYEQNVEETLEVPTKEDDGGVIEDAETLIELEENEQPLEMVEEKNDMGEKEICEPDDLTPSIKLPEMLKEKEEPTEIHSLHENEINASRNDTSFVQQQDDLLPSKPLECNLGRPVEEFEESGDINNDVMGAEVSVDQDSHKNSSTSRKRWFDSNEVSETFIKLEEDGNQSESVEEEDVIEEKEICEIEGLALGVKLAEILKQMEDVIDIPSCDTDGPSTFRNAMNSGQNHDEQLAGEPEVECNLGKHVEELGDMNKGSVEPEVAAVSPEQNINSSKSSHRKRWFDSGNETTVAQAPPIFAIHSLRRNLEQENYGHPETTDHTSQEMGRESRANLTTKKSGTNYTPQREVEPEKKENQQEAQTGKEFEVSATLQKELEREKEHRIQKAAKQKEREMQREQKKAVEQVMREARQRSFAEAQRAAEIRQKAEAQRRLGKTSVQANDTSLAEMASEEAKQKSERAYVERATQEARDRALEKALSEKIASEAGKQAKRSVSEKSYGVSPDGKQAKRSVSEKLSASSRDNGVNSSFDLDSKVSLSTSRSSSSLTQCDPSTANGESTQRCKAKLERNQRTAERAAKALAEKNKRDLLVQHEQAERNRLAEVLDAEVKRWSSGKERNLRALVSTLQYILGPDSGWQPVPLTDIVTAVGVKKAYRKAALCVHPDKLQQRGASIQQKYTCEKVFDLLKEAWNRFSAEER